MTPPLPAGYALDQASQAGGAPPLPPGYKMDAPSPAAPAGGTTPPAAPQAPPSYLSQVGSVLKGEAKGIGDVFNPVPLAKNLFSDIRHPIESAKLLTKASPSDWLEATGAPSVYRGLKSGDPETIGRSLGNIGGMAIAPKVIGKAAKLLPPVLEKTGIAPQLRKLRDVGPQEYTRPVGTKMAPPTPPQAGPELKFNLPEKGLTAEANAKVASGQEQIFKGAAPVGTNVGFRDNLDAASGDLAQIGREAVLPDAPPRNAFTKQLAPDLRVRRFVEATDAYTKKMYETERKPLIDAHADEVIQPDFGPDERTGLEYLAGKAGNSHLQSLAQKALSGDHLRLSEVDELARLVNKEQIPFESSTPDKQAIQLSVSPKIGGLKPLGTKLDSHIASTLSDLGEPGIVNYERRMAGIKAVRNQVHPRMNAAELQGKPGLVPEAYKAVRGLWSGNVEPTIANASQAAVADVNLGEMLQKGLKDLADSGITPKRDIGTGAPPKVAIPQAAVPETPGPSMFRSATNKNALATRLTIEPGVEPIPEEAPPVVPPTPPPAEPGRPASDTPPPEPTVTTPEPGIAQEEAPKPFVSKRRGMRESERPEGEMAGKFEGFLASKGLDRTSFSDLKPAEKNDVILEFSSHRDQSTGPAPADITQMDPRDIQFDTKRLQFRSQTGESA